MTNTSRRRRTALTLIATAAGAALALTGCSSDTGSGAEGGDGDLVTLKVATIGLTSDGALITGIEQGFFEEEGLRIETSIVANPPAGLAAAQSGQVDVAYSPSIPFLNALDQGLPLKIIQSADGYADGAAAAADTSRLDDTGLLASADGSVTSVEQLGGKTVAVPARKAQLEVTIASVASDAGVDPSTINWVVLDMASAVEALENNTVAAAGLVSPFTGQAEAAGAALLSAPGLAFFEEGAVGLWTAGSSTIESKADAIAGFQRAIVKSNEYANAHIDEAMQAGLDYTESPLTLEDLTTDAYWPTEVREVDIQRVNDKLVALGYLPGAVDLTGVIVPTP